MDIETAMEKADKLSIFKGNSYKLELKQLLTAKSFLVFIKYNDGLSSKLLKAAYINAIICFAEHRNISRNLGLELMLFASMTDQINDAINKLGPVAGKPFVAITDNLSIKAKINRVSKIEEFRQERENHNLLIEQLSKMGISRIQK
ncbi:MAG: KEOPS complex subunit Cgi121 [Methanothrix sp.]